MTKSLTVDDIDEVIASLVFRGPAGPEASVTLARIAGRAIKMLHTIEGPRAAIATAETLAKHAREGAFQ